MRKRPVFVSFLLSYAILLSVIMLITTAIYTQVFNVMVTEIHDTYDRFLKQTGKDVDTILESYRKLALGLSMQLKVEALASNKQPMDAEQRQITIDVHNILRNVGASDSSIEYAYLYLPWKEAVLSSFGYSGVQEYYDNYAGKLFDNQDEWIDMMKNVHYNDIVSRNGKLIFIVTLPVGRLNAYDGAIILQVNPSTILERLDVVTDTYRGTTAVVDKNGKVILTRRRDTEFFKVPLETGLDGRISHNNRSILVNRIKSTACDWEYLSLVSEDDLLNKARIIRTTMIISALVCIILGIFMTLMFSRKNYRPLQRLLDLFGKTDSSSNIQKINEYRYMEKVIGSFIQEKDMLAEQLRGHWNELREQFLRRLLKGYLSKPLSDYPEQKILGSNLENMWKVVFLLGGVEDAYLTATISSINRAVFPGAEVTCFNIDDSIGGIISFNNGEPDVPELRRTIEAIYETVVVLTGEGVSMGYSRSCIQAEALPVVYEEAHSALEYKQLLNGEGIACINDLPDKDNDTNISFHDQIKLQNALKAGNYNEAGKIFDDIIARYFPKTGVSTQMIKCRMFGLINTIVLSISETNIQKHDTFWEDIKPVDRLLKCNTVRELTRESQSIFRKLNTAMECNRIKLLGEKQKEISQYLLEHYRDQDLSVAMIADHFEMHPTYLSRQFKQLNHINLLDKIHGLRIDEAKRLLEDQALSMREISSRIGYNNELSFFRAFKRQEGVTPSQHKSNHAEVTSR